MNFVMPMIQKPSVSPNKMWQAVIIGLRIEVTNLSKPFNNSWPWPAPGERMRYHLGMAAEFEKGKDHFAAAFHLGQVLLQEPGNVAAKQRRDAALKAHQEAIQPKK
jgi:hypothetical protein